MALIFLGQTRCPLCGELLQEGEGITGLPPTANKNHVLYKYFDSGFHLNCFDAWDKKAEVLNIIEDEKRQFRSSAEYKDMFQKYGRPRRPSEPD